MLLVLMIFALCVLLVMAIRPEWWPFIGLFFGTYAFGLFGGKLSRPRTSIEAQQRVLLVLLVPAGLLTVVLILMLSQSPFWPLGGAFFGAYLVGLFGGRFLRTRPTDGASRPRDAWMEGCSLDLST